MSFKVVTANAMIVYLAHHRGQETTLAELSSRFNIPWKKALELLWMCVLVDIDGYALPFDISLPPLPGQEEEGEEKTTAASSVSFSDTGELDIPDLPVVLPELISLLAILDSIAEITPVSEERKALAGVRSKLVSAAQRAGFSSAMWEAPTALVNDSILFQLDQAIKEGTWINLSYARPGKEVRSMRVLPFEIRSDYRPVLLAWCEEGVRSLRIDRIVGLDLSRKARRSEKKAGKLAVENNKTWEPQGDTITLKVTAQGRWIAAALPGATSTEEDDGTTRVTFQSASDTFLRSLLIQLGTSVISLEPESANKRLRSFFSSLKDEERKKELDTRA